MKHKKRAHFNICFNILTTISYTRAHRILHWLIATVFMFIILTVFLRQNWMNKDQVGQILSDKLLEHGILLSKKDASLIGKAVRYPMWKFHAWAGYVLVLLYIARMILFKVQGAVFNNPFKRDLPLKERSKAIIYSVFYLCLGITLVTGLILVWGPKSNRELHHFAQGIHIQSLYYALTFIVLHLGGLVLAELGSDKGIISRMIHGRK